MNKIVTLSIADLNEKNKSGKIMNPKQSTIDFLKQFARVYSYNNNLRNNLGGFIAN
ncbi:MAG: hypothetical protein RR061_01615 [Muribaculaceae bacterium]